VSATALFDGELDLPRMRAERLTKLQHLIAGDGLDALVLLGGSNVTYATGATTMTSDPGRAYHEPVMAVVLPDGPPHVFTPHPEGIPPELPDDRRHGPLQPEFPEGVEAMGGVLRDLLGGGAVRIGYDELTAAMFDRLTAEKVELVDAGTVLGAAKICKTADELECIRRSQRINETAMYDVLAALRPGMRQSELSGIFLQRIFELGATGNVIDPIWQATPDAIASGPFTVHGDVAFPTGSTDRILRQDDLVLVDTGMSYHGYASDFGRTWLVGTHSVTPRQRGHFDRWSAVMGRVLERIRPGVTGRDLVQTACDGEPAGRRPWLKHFYLAHGIGTDSAEMPLIGTDLGDEFDESIVLAPGMVLVLEPVIWDDGEGGYRSEEVVAVTDDGYELLGGAFPYAPFDGRGAPW